MHDKRFVANSKCSNGAAYIRIAAHITTMPDEDTSIRISVKTWRRLKDRKDRPNTSFDDVISELLDKTEELESVGNSEPVPMAD
jgi:hypothetical protein